MALILVIGHEKSSVAHLNDNYIGHPNLTISCSKLQFRTRKMIRQQNHERPEGLK